MNRMERRRTGSGTKEKDEHVPPDSFARRLHSLVPRFGLDSATHTQSTLFASFPVRKVDYALPGIRTRENVGHERAHLLSEVCVEAVRQVSVLRDSLRV